MNHTQALNTVHRQQTTVFGNEISSLMPLQHWQQKITTT